MRGLDLIPCVTFGGVFKEGGDIHDAHLHRQTNKPVGILSERASFLQFFTRMLFSNVSPSELDTNLKSQCQVHVMHNI